MNHISWQNIIWGWFQHLNEDERGNDVVHFVLEKNTFNLKSHGNFNHRMKTRPQKCPNFTIIIRDKHKTKLYVHNHFLHPFLFILLGSRHRHSDIYKKRLVITNQVQYNFMNIFLIITVECWQGINFSYFITTFDKINKRLNFTKDNSASQLYFFYEFTLLS